LSTIELMTSGPAFLECVPALLARRLYQNTFRTGADSHIQDRRKQIITACKQFHIIKEFTKLKLLGTLRVRIILFWGSLRWSSGFLQDSRYSSFYFPTTV